MGHCGTQKSRRRSTFFVGMDGREGDAGVIVDGQLHVVPAPAARAAAQIAVGPRPRSGETAQLLDIQMEQVSGRRVL